MYIVESERARKGSRRIAQLSSSVAAALFSNGLGGRSTTYLPEKSSSSVSWGFWTRVVTLRYITRSTVYFFGVLINLVVALRIFCQRRSQKYIEGYSIILPLLV